MSQQLVNSAIATMIDESEIVIGDDSDVGAWDRISDWIRTACQQPGKSQVGLAKATGIPVTGVNRLAHGGRKLDALELSKVVDYLGEPPDDIKRLLTKLAQVQRTREPKPLEDGDANRMMRQIMFELHDFPTELLPQALDAIRGLKAAYEMGEAHPRKAGKA